MLRKSWERFNQLKLAGFLKMYSFIEVALRYADIVLFSVSVTCFVLFKDVLSSGFIVFQNYVF